MTKLPVASDAVHLDEKPEPGIAWIEGSGLANGTLEIEVRGRDVLQQSFVGLAFHGKDSQQRQEFPEKFEHSVDPSLNPDGWVDLRIVVEGEIVQVYDGPGTAPVLEIHKLGGLGKMR